MRFDDYFRDLTIDRRADAPQTPTVSIILPTYARAEGRLGAAIDSVLSQSYGDFELIVVDDGSRDGTADLLNAYRQADPRISVHRYEFNSGLPALRVDQAAMSARGRLIGYQFDDDLWTPDSLAVRVEALNKCERPSVVYGIAEAEIPVPGQPTLFRRLGDSAFNYGRLAGGNFIANNSVLHSAELFEMAGMYDPHVLIRRFSDYDLWLRFGAVADFIALDAVVAKIHALQPNSLAKSIPLDYNAFRKYLAIPRNAALKPGRIRDFEVTGTAALARGFSLEEIDQIRRRSIIPFLTLHHDYASTEKLLPAMISRRSRKKLLVAKPDYSTSIDVTIRNFTGLEDCPFRDFFVPERDLGGADLSGVDTLVMYRTVMAETTHVIRALKRRKSLVYLMDDNMLRLDEAGPEHRFLAPGTPSRIAIEAQIAEADACIGYSDQIIADMSALNPHSLRLNTSIPLRFLEPRPYRRGSRLRVAILSGPVRREILHELWPALVAFAQAHRDAVEFHIWGMDPAEFAPLPCPVSWQPFTHAYDLYRTRLLEATFDIVLVPLDDKLLASHSKSPVKLLESICCGAICLFTDSPPYRGLPDEICLKARNSVADWQAMLERALALGPEGRSAMLERARAFVQERYATERHLTDFVASFDAADLHRRLGRRKIAYVFHETALGGATLHLLRHAQLARSLAFDLVGVVGEAVDEDRWGFLARWNKASGGAPLVNGRWRSGYLSPGPEARDRDDTHRAPDPDDHRHGERLARQLAPHHVGLIHATTWNPAAAFLGRSLKVPIVLSLHQFLPTEAGAARGAADAIHSSSLRYARAWEQATQRPARRMVCPVEPVFFEAFAANLERHRRDGTGLRLLMSGTVQPRKNQLEAIGAVGLLVRRGYDVTLDLIGYDDVVPGYPDSCRQAVAALGLQDRVLFHGFVDKPESFFQGRAQILLMASTDESMPQTVLQAMAAGLLVVTTEVGGVSEIIRHRYGGLVAEGTDAAALADAIALVATFSRDRIEEMLRRAHRSVELIGREDHVRAELIDLYNEAFEISSFGERPEAASTPMAIGMIDSIRQISMLQARVQQLETSLSYRMTAPLRAVARKLRPVAWLANQVRRRDR